MFGLRRVVGMGLIFERVLFVDLNVVRVLFTRFRISWRIRCGCDRCLDGCRNRQLDLGFWRCSFLRGMTVVVLIMGVLMRMVRMLLNVLVRMLMAFMIMVIGICRMPSIVGVAVPIFTVFVVLMLVIVRLGGLRRFGTFRVDDLALHPLAIAAAA